MSNKRTPPTQPASWRQMLQAQPVQNAAAEVTHEDAGQVKIKVEKRKPRFLVPPVSWLVRPRLWRVLRLDELGSQIWELSGKSSTVEEIVDAFAESHSLSFHEARVSVTGYIKLLVERGALVMVRK